jgi:hypothetical protein
MQNFSLLCASYSIFSNDGSFSWKGEDYIRNGPISLSTLHIFFELIGKIVFTDNVA